MSSHDVAVFNPSNLCGPNCQNVLIAVFLDRQDMNIPNPRLGIHAGIIQVSTAQFVELPVTAGKIIITMLI